MSGIVGVRNLDGAPVDRQFLQQLTCFLTPRGPDAQQIWVDGPVGFGHTLFKTTEESEYESQPFTLGSGTWITADARIDARHELIDQLKACGQQPAPHATDPELILRAYEAWGESCIEHLLGDFAFGIWDGRRQQLFCARDQMGVRPLYYAQIGSFVVFSNALDCIRQCSVVSDRLNDLAIADFLLFELNQDPATTCFADIYRLPPAHCASWSASGFRKWRYWTMPIDEPIFYKRKDDYCDRFKELLREAVDDRLRTNRVGVFMSGGLDSPTLAATARDVLRARYSNFDLQAFTSMDSSHPEETHYAGLAARYLEIPIHFDKWEPKSIDPHWERIPFQTPEPCGSGWNVIPNRIYYQRAGSHSRVFFWGEGPDNVLLFEWRAYLSYLTQRHHYGRLLSATCSTLISQRRPPFWGRISKFLRLAGRDDETRGSFPPWLNQAFESHWHLRTRWNDTQGHTPTSRHPVHPQAYASLQLPLWQQLFEGEDAGAMGTFLEMRHPFFDLRVLRFMLACPPLPWCRSKYLIRRAMCGALPDQILKRKKSGISFDQVRKYFASFGLEPFRPAPEILCFVDPEQVPVIPSDDQWIFAGHSRVRSLNHWLQYSRRRLHNPSVEGPPNGTASRVFTATKEAL
jgi:asparagine synthase (glutamine-hydrolysing)